MTVRSCLAAVVAVLACKPSAGEPSPPATETKAEPQSTAAIDPPPAGEKRDPAVLDPLPDERHFVSLRQLTFGGENAEAYLSFDEKRLVFQSTRDGASCDAIYVMDLGGGEAKRVSSGKGRTTCSYFLPG